MPGKVLPGIIIDVIISPELLASDSETKVDNIKLGES